MEFVSFFKSFVPPSPVPSSEPQDQVVRKIVVCYARGNVSLQLGRFTTAQQIERRKAALAKHAFT